MERQINRRFKLKPDEVRKAVLLWLGEKQDVPLPRSFDDIEFEVDESGAVISWTEDAIMETC